MAWWTAWLWRQLAKDSKTSNPRPAPSQALARLDGRNEPWAQSWNTMNVRGPGSPRRGIASASASRYEKSSARYISTESAAYGTTDVAMSATPRPSCGRS